MLKALLPSLIQTIKPMILSQLDERGHYSISESLFKEKLQEMVPEIDLVIKDGKIVFFRLGVEIEF